MLNAANGGDIAALERVPAGGNLDRLHALYVFPPPGPGGMRVNLEENRHHRFQRAFWLRAVSILVSAGCVVNVSQCCRASDDLLRLTVIDDPR